MAVVYAGSDQLRLRPEALLLQQPRPGAAGAHAGRSASLYPLRPSQRSAGGGGAPGQDRGNHRGSRHDQRRVRPHLPRGSARRRSRTRFGTRNPEFWLKPLPGSGVVAGQVLALDSTPIARARPSTCTAGMPGASARRTRTRTPSTLTRRGRRTSCCPTSQRRAARLVVPQDSTQASPCPSRYRRADCGVRPSSAWVQPRNRRSRAGI